MDFAIYFRKNDLSLKIKHYMKTVFRTAAILALACTASLTSCKKKSMTEDSNDILNSIKDDAFYESDGSVSAKFSGNLKGFSGYTNAVYSETRTFSFVQDNVDGTPSNVVETTRNAYTDKSSPSDNYDFTVKSFSIRMYSANGESKTDLAIREHISISFNIYEGNLPKYMLDRGIKVGSPIETSVSYKIAYNPEKTIDVLDVNGHIGYDYSEMTPYSIVNNVNISDFKFDSESGKIEFSFSGDDRLDTDNNEKISEGKVSTTILMNIIQPEEVN